MLDSVGEWRLLLDIMAHVENLEGELKGRVAVEQLQQVDERLRDVQLQERPDMTERIESIERSMQV